MTKLYNIIIEQKRLARGLSIITHEHLVKQDFLDQSI